MSQVMKIKVRERHYEDIWRQLREAGFVTVVGVEPEFMNRVIKAVRKEKWLDLGFKMLNTHDTYRLVAEKIEEEGKIIFELKAILNLQDRVTV